MLELRVNPLRSAKSGRLPVTEEYRCPVTQLCRKGAELIFLRRAQVRGRVGFSEGDRTNMKKLTTRIGLGLSVIVLAASATSLALAADAPKDGARPQCSGEHEGKRTDAERAQHAADRFKKSDKNNDGFLTQAEVGDKRWSHIQVADANKDGKVTQAELAQAHADGKLGHGKRPA